MLAVPPVYVPASAPIATTVAIANVPYYSQFTDISSTKWQKVGCGIASLAMVIDYYSTDSISVDKLLSQAIAAGAYDQNAGWKHKDLIQLSKKYGLDGNTYDLSGLSSESAFSKLKAELAKGPVIVSVHYKFEPKNPIPHLVVIDGVDANTVYYNDPAAKGAKKQIAKADFIKAWKKRYIVMRPVATKVAVDVSMPSAVPNSSSFSSLLKSFVGSVIG